jgi:hypothetical protein
MTHCSDASAPTPLGALFLDDPRICRWIAQNPSPPPHRKVVAAPIGVATRQHAHGNVDVLLAVAAEANRSESKRIERIYVNFDARTSTTRPALARAMSGRKDVTFVAERKPYGAYLRDIASHKFVLSPRGNGVDTHRFWEAVALGSTPVFEPSTLSPLYTRAGGVEVARLEDAALEALRGGGVTSSTQRVVPYHFGRGVVLNGKRSC